MARTSKVTTRELRTVREDPEVVGAVERHRRAAREWAGRIAVLEVQRDRDLGRREREIEAAETAALSRLRAGTDAPGAGTDEQRAPVEEGAGVPEPVEARRRHRWRRKR